MSIKRRVSKLEQQQEKETAVVCVSCGLTRMVQTPMGERGRPRRCESATQGSM